MTQPRYQVFLSSTFSDLQDERLAVTQALLQLGCIPAGMELFPASDLPPWGVIAPIIDSTDYFVLVVAGRYGSMSDVGVSYTEREYDYAHERGIPVLAFVHSAPEDLPVKYAEPDSDVRARLQAFRDKIRSRHTVQEWRTAGELAQHVTISLQRAFVSQPRPGWLRGDGTDNAKTPQPTANQIDRLATSPTRPLRYQSLYAWPPPDTPPPGWAVLPLLQIRTVAALLPANADSVEAISPEVRKELTAQLNRSALTRGLGRLEREHPSAPATVDGSQTLEAVLDGWHPAPGGHQTTRSAAYRLGADALSGSGALATVLMPSTPGGELVRSIVDVGLSFQLPLHLAEIALLLRDTVLAAGLDIPRVIAGLLPPETTMVRMEVHLVAANTDGRGFNRPNGLERQILWAPLGGQTRQLHQSMGVSAILAQPLAAADTPHFVMGALRQMALDSGFLELDAFEREVGRALQVG